MSLLLRLAARQHTNNPQMEQKPKRFLNQRIRISMTGRSITINEANTGHIGLFKLPLARRGEGHKR